MSKHLTRRQFLGRTTLAAAALGTPLTALGRELAAASQEPVTGARHRIQSPFVRNGKPLLVIVEGSDTEKMLQAGLAALGGLNLIVRAGELVAIKPNIVSDQPFPVTTDPDFVIAFAKHVRKAGTDKIMVCDSPMKNGPRTQLSFDRNGWFEKGADAGVQIEPIDNSIDANYRLVRDERWQHFPQLRTDRRMLEAPVLINMPTLKRHAFPGMSCALKAYLGAVHWGDRQRAHGETSKGVEGQNFFKRSIAEFADSLRSELTIVDARALLVKGGPTLGTGPAEVKKGVNRMIFGSDMVAVDSYAAQLMREHDDTFSPATIDVTNEWAEKLGLGVADLKRVEIVEVSAA